MMRILVSMLLLAVSMDSLHAGKVSFSQTTFAAGGVQSQSICMADFSGDGTNDLAVSNYSSHSISVFLNQGVGNFGLPVVTPLAGSTFGGTIVCGDLDEDGKIDVAVGNVTPGATLILLGNGNGTFRQLPLDSNTFGFLSARIVDLNGDGHKDLLVGGNGPLAVWLGRGDGTFSTPGTTLNTTAGLFLGIGTGDINADSKVDLVALDFNFGGGGMLGVFLGNGMGSFQPPVYQSALTSGPDSVALADFNKDGRLDLLVGYSLGTAIVAPGNGSGSFLFSGANIVYATGNSQFNGMAVQAADLDLDGSADLILSDAFTGVLTLVLNDGTGTFPNARTNPSNTFSLRQGLRQIAVGDLSGDGIPDLAVVNSQFSEVSVFLSIKQLTSVAITSDASVQLAGVPIRFTVQVTSPGGIPRGTATLFDAGTQVGQATLESSGSATISVSNFSPGSHSVSAIYTGTGNFSGSTSVAIPVSVTDLAITAAPPTQTVSGGQAATYTVTLTPVAGFVGDVVLGCTGLPAARTCSFSPAVASIGGSPAVVSLTIGATAQNAALAATGGLFSNTGRGIALGMGGVWLGLFFQPWAKRRRKKWVLLMALLPTALLMPSCGGSKSSGTRVGSYAITIDASTVSAGTKVSRSTSVTLVVR